MKVCDLLPRLRVFSEALGANKIGVIIPVGATYGYCNKVYVNLRNHRIELYDTESNGGDLSVKELYQLILNLRDQKPGGVDIATEYSIYIPKPFDTNTIVPLTDCRLQGDLYLLPDKKYTTSY